MFLLNEVDMASNKNVTINQSFLCANQIVVCIKNLEKTFQQEIEKKISLISSRQCFFERIMWCLARLKSTIMSANDQVFIDTVEENFISILDSIFEMLSEFDENLLCEINKNNACSKAEMMMKSRELRCLIEKLLSHALAFANILNEKDMKPLKVLSQKVLKVTLEFEEEFSLSGLKKTNFSLQKLKASELECAIYGLEKFVNEALLRLVFDVFECLNFNLKTHLKSFEHIVEVELDAFDLLIERLLQIGQFAVAFTCQDHKLSSAIKSCLASLESLDSYLIPSITTRDPSMNIFKDHFENEIRQLQNFIQQMIDTIAFLSCFIDEINMLTESNKKDFNKTSLIKFLERGNIVMSHLQINCKSLQLNDDKVAIFYFNDFKLILAECESILHFPGEIDDFQQRTLKRFRILLNTTKKLQSAIKNVQNFNENQENEAGKFQMERIAHVDGKIEKKIVNYFESIQPSKINSVLYESKRYLKDKVTTSEEMKKFQPSSPSQFSEKVIRKSTRKKRDSLRIAMFRKQQDKEVEEEFNENFNESMTLQITEILDKLSEFPSTF